MAHETVPADIAAAIEAYTRAAADAVRVDYGFDSWFDDAELATARAALDAAILKHLRNADGMKAALEAQTSGGA